MSVASKASIFASALLLVLIVSRAIFSLITGYILPDESFYLSIFTMNGGLGFSSYRPFFHLVFAVFFYGTDSLQSLIVRGAAFEAVWALGCIFVFSRLLKELDVSERARSLSILALPFFPVFSVMAVFFVTETVALFLVLTGLFFTVRFFKSDRLRDMALSALFFVFAAQTREPYMVLLLGIPLYLLFRKSWKAFVVYAPIASIAAPFPTRLFPLAIDTPVQRFLFDYLPSLIPRYAPTLLGGQGNPILGGGIGGAQGNNVTGVGVTATSKIPPYVFFAQSHVALVANAQVGLAFLEGLAFGFGPLALLVFASFYFTRSRFVLFVSLASLLAYLVVVDFSVIFLPDATTLWSSNIFRLSSAALPSALCLGWLFQKRVPLKVFGSIFCIGLVVAVPMSSILQSSQNVGGGVDRLSLDYRAPYYRMAEIAQPGSLIIANVGLPQMQTFASFDRNVTVVGLPTNMGNFTVLIEKGWSHIYLYDSWISLQNRAFLGSGKGDCGCYPQYYIDILYSHSVDGYLIVPVFENGESYALELMK